MRPLLLLALLPWVLPLIVAQNVWQPMQRRTTDSSLQLPANVGEQAMAVAGQSVYVAWVDDRSGPWRVVLARSPDGGRTWLPERGFGQVTPTSQDGSLQVVAGNAHVHLFWQETRLLGGSVGHHAWSLDHGATWYESMGPNIPATCDRVLCEGDTLVLLQGTAMCTSTDGGASWSPPRPIGAAIGTHLFQLQGPVEGALSLGVLHVLWMEGASWNASHRSYYNCSADLGISWQPADRLLQNTPGNDTYQGRLVVDGPRGFVVWYENVVGTPQLFADRTLDGGKTWLAAHVSLNNLFPTLAGATFAFAGNSLCMLAEQASGSYWQRVNARSLDFGATWSPVGPPIVTVRQGLRGLAFGAIEQHAGMLLFATGYVDRWFLPWSNIAFLVASLDGGATWQGFASASRATWWSGGGGLPQLASADGSIFGLAGGYSAFGWGGPTCLWFAGSRPLGGAAGGAGFGPPELRVDRTPIPGNSFGLQLRDPGGGAAALISFGVPSGPQAFLAGQLMIDPGPYLLVMLATGPGGSSEATVPMDFGWRLPMFLTSIACQAFVPDARAPFGVAMSGALEIRVL